MMLTDVKAYLAQKRLASLDQLAIHFDVAPSAMRGMVDVLIAKGRVRAIACESDCGGGCRSCGMRKSLELFAWQERYGGKERCPVAVDSLR